MRRLGPLAVVLLLVVAACDDDAATTTTTSTTRLPSAEEVLADAAATMEAVETLRYEIELSGAPITLLGFGLSSAIGEYAAPDASQAQLKVVVSGLTIELATIAIGDRSWVEIPIVGGWDEYTGSRSFNPAIIFDPELGWRPLLTTDIRDPRFVEVADDRYRVAGTTAPERVEVLTAGLVEAQPVDLIIDIDRTSGVVTGLDFTTDGEAGETTWMLRLSEFGSEVSIDPPPVR
jgi:lipoprotein LprG